MEQIQLQDVNDAGTSPVMTPVFTPYIPQNNASPQVKQSPLDDKDDKDNKEEGEFMLGKAVCRRSGSNSSSNSNSSCKNIGSSDSSDESSRLQRYEFHSALLDTCLIMYCLCYAAPCRLEDKVDALVLINQTLLGSRKEGAERDKNSDKEEDLARRVSQLEAALVRAHACIYAYTNMICHAILFILCLK